ncbi:MAG TPA: DNA methyltransferase [Leptospiraceae bacterium]|nr:DNA methyltransferase [Leptospiraceae bacterium]
MTQEIWFGDCLELIKTITDKSVDLIITDPPYKMTKNGKSCRPNYMPVNSTENLFEGNLPSTKEWMTECFRVLKDGSHFYTFCSINDISNYLNCATQAGFKLHNILTMIKDTKMPNRWYLKFSEMVLFFRKGNAKPINDMTSRDYEFVTMPTLKSGKLHPTQKPLPFIEKLVKNSTKENEIVLDIFAGSGTTLLAAKNLNRQFIGIEKEEKYVEIIKQD